MAGGVRAGQRALGLKAAPLRPNLIVVRAGDIDVRDDAARAQLDNGKPPIMWPLAM